MLWRLPAPFCPAEARKSSRSRPSFAARRRNHARIARKIGYSPFSHFFLDHEDALLDFPDREPRCERQRRVGAEFSAALPSDPDGSPDGRFFVSPRAVATKSRTHHG